MRLLAFAVFSLTIISCDSVLLGAEEDVVSLEQNLGVPAQRQDGLVVGEMGEAGVDATSIKKFISKLHADNNNVHSILIIKNGKLVVESYFNGWHSQRLQSIRSATKSVTSALIGIAIDKGFVESENAPVLDFFPEYSDLRSAERDNIQLRHLLMMSSGLEWDQVSFPDDDPRNDEHQLGESYDGFRFVLEKKYVSAPGTAFNYSSGNTDLLAGVVYTASEKYADAFAEEHLFSRLGILHYGWRKNNNGHPNAGYGLHLYPRDLLKIGKLFLDSGVWNNERIVSKEWIAKSTSKKISYPFDKNQSYGYQWWLREWDIDGRMIKSFQAQGNGGQVLCVIPELNAVVLLTGRNYGNRSSLPYSYLENIIIPAIK